MMRLYKLWGVVLLFGLYSCKDDLKTTDSDGWVTESVVVKEIDNVTFTFPSEGYAFENKDRYVKETFNAIKHNLDLLEISRWNDSVYVQFFDSREAITKYAGSGVSGLAHPHINTVLVVANNEQEPPIKHEMMHLIPMLVWGYTPRSSIWLNEGLATFSENDCMGYSVAEVYRYMLEHDHLIPLEDLASDFYSHSEMIAYHQSGYIASYLLDTYGIEKIKELWLGGFRNFETIYGVPYQDMIEKVNERVRKEISVMSQINWEQFLKGCNPS